MAAPGLQLSVRITARGVIASLVGALMLGLGIWWGYRGLVVLGTALLLLVLLALASVLMPAPVTATRRISPLRVPRQGRCTGTLRVVNDGRFAIGLDAAEQVGDDRVPVLVPRLAAAEAAQVAYPIPTARRGVVTAGPLRLRRLGVAGLAVARGTVGDPIQVHVLPRVLPVAGLPPGVRRGHVGADERVERGGTDLRSLREYVPGDDLRRVHWATSARRGSLMVREDADPSLPYLTVLLDDRATSYHGDEFEDAVEAAASLVTSVLDAGHPVRLLAVSGALDIEVAAAPPGMPAPGADDVLQALASAQCAVGAATPPPLRDLDVVVVASGSAADLAPLVTEAARAPLGVVLLVAGQVAEVSAAGGVLVLRAPGAEELLATWDAAVAAPGALA